MKGLGDYMEMKLCKCARILYIYSKFQESKVVKTKSLEREFNVTKRTIQRDIEELRAFYANKGCKDGDYRTIEFDKAIGGYILKSVA